MRILRNNRLLIAMISMSLAGLDARAQDQGWESKILDRGKISVNYRFTEQKNEQGEKVLLIKDSSSMTEKLDFQKCISVMKDVSVHQEFTGDHISRMIKDLSENEALVYYYAKNPWPLANSDCVAKMISRVDTTDCTAEFTLIAAPDEMPMGEVARMTHYQVRYLFQGLENGKVIITVMGQSTPPVKVPNWMVKSAFPGLPAKCLRNFVNLAQNF